MWLLGGVDADVSFSLMSMLLLFLTLSSDRHSAEQLILPIGGHVNILTRYKEIVYQMFLFLDSLCNHVSDMLIKCRQNHIHLGHVKENDNTSLR